MRDGTMPSAVRRAQQMLDDEEKKRKKELEDGDGDGDGSPDGNPDPNAEPGDGHQAPPDNDDDRGTPDGDGDGIDWKAEHQKLNARFSVVQGKYNAEVPLLTKQLQTLTAEVERLKAGGGDSTGDGDGKPPKKVDFDPDASEAELVNLYGPDFVQYVKAAAQKLVDAQVGPLRERFEKMDQDDAKATETNFYDAIQEAHPDWEQINVLEGWLIFLGTADPASGMRRQDIIDAAQERGDPQPVIHQMTEFKRQNASGSERMSGTTVPGDTSGTGQGKPKDEKVYAASTIRQFYKNVATGRYRGREDEAARMEMLFAAALEENRIDESA